MRRKLRFSRAARSERLPSTNPISESVPKIQANCPLSESVAVFARKSFSLVDGKSKILYNADLRRGIQRVAESVAEREVRIDVAVDRRERSLAVVPFEVSILDRAGRSFENLMKPKPATDVERSAD